MKTLLNIIRKLVGSPPKLEPVRVISYIPQESFKNKGGR